MFSFNIPEKLTFLSPLKCNKKFTELARKTTKLCVFFTPYFSSTPPTNPILSFKKAEMRRGRHVCYFVCI